MPTNAGVITRNATVGKKGLQVGFRVITYGD